MPTHVNCKCSSVALTDKGVAVEVTGKVVAAWFIRIREAVQVTAICLLFLQIRLAARAEVVAGERVEGEGEARQELEVVQDATDAARNETANAAAPAVLLLEVTKVLANRHDQ